MPEPENDVKVSVTDKSVSEWLKDKDGVAVFITGDGRPGQGDATSISLVDATFDGLHIELADLSAEDDKALATWLQSDAERSEERRVGKEWGPGESGGE